MPGKTPYAELVEIREMLRRLKHREADLIGLLREKMQTAEDSKTAPRPGWPVQRLPEHRAG